MDKDVIYLREILKRLEQLEVERRKIITELKYLMRK